MKGSSSQSQRPGRVRREVGAAGRGGVVGAGRSTLGLEEGGQPWVQDDGHKESERQGDQKQQQPRRGPSPSPAVQGTWQLWGPWEALSLLERDREERTGQQTLWPADQRPLVGKPTRQPGRRCPGLNRRGWGGLGEAVSPTSTQTDRAQTVLVGLRMCDPRGEGGTGLLCH